MKVMKVTKYALPFFILTSGLAVTTWAASLHAAPKSIVSDESIAKQKALTKSHKLSNGIQVTTRSIPGSDILALAISFEGGQRDIPTGRKSLNRWAFGAMPMAAAGYPRAKVHELTEKYSLAMTCGGGIEYSNCSISTVSEYWSIALPLLTAIVTKPEFAEADINLVKDRMKAQLRNTTQEPEQYVNEVVNRIYYPAGHPYRLNHDESLAELEKLSRTDLVDFHKNTLNASRMRIVVVSSMPEKKLLADLEKAFGKIKSSKAETIPALDAAFSIDQSYAFEDRDIPTAYIRAKFDAPSVTSKDAVASRLMFEILSEELGDEIRTKRSLSYSVYSFGLQYSKGIGAIGASTSKPEETLSAMNDVIKKMKTHSFSEDDINQHKNGFSTAYYLTQETHASLAEALLGSLNYYGNTDYLYELPRALDKVNAAEIKRLANQILVNMRVGVIFPRSKFKDEWAKNLISQNLAK